MCHMYISICYVLYGVKIKSSIQYPLLIMCYEPIVTISYNDGKYNYIFQILLVHVKTILFLL